MIKLLVGLGNPGQEYFATRHNQGFCFLDYISSQYELIWRKNQRFNAEITFLSLFGVNIVMAKPQTYMNCSGFTVSKIKNFYKFHLDEILVIHDDLDLHPGFIKFKKGGATGGHNGLKSIQTELGSADFFRLRIGIGHPRNIHISSFVQNKKKIINIADYVLSRPETDEEMIIQKGVKIALEKLELLLAGDLSLNQIISMPK